MALIIDLTVRSNADAKLAVLNDPEFADAALMAGALALKGKMDDYPPSFSVPGRYSVRTRRPMGWYKRGTGWMEPVVKNGVALTYRNREATSETFGRRWTIARRGPGEVVIGNNTSYGPYLKSKVKVEGKGPQSRLMRAYRWTLIEDDFAQNERSIKAQIERALESRFE